MPKSIDSFNTSPGEAEVSATDLEVIYKETDKLYAILAKRCGLSDCAYWILYAIERDGGATTQSEFADYWSYSKQTIHSAVKALREKGYIELQDSHNDKRSKLIVYTEAGNRFCEKNIRPAIEAEARAFASLEPTERSELVRLATKFSLAIENEITSMNQLLENQ